MKKVLHCCLACFYIDNYGYQENILPKMHKKLGYDVKILASTETYVENKQLGYVEPKTYFNEDNIEVTRVPYIKWLPAKLVRKLRIYKGVKKFLNSYQPDIIFVHDLQFLSIRQIVKYAKKKNVKIYVDCHADYVNSGRSFVSMNILHKFIYKKCAKKIIPYAEKFYGTLPVRCDFLNEVYGVPKDKIELLVMGVDDSKFAYEDKGIIREETRGALGISKDTFLIVTGGKIDANKNIHILAQSINKISNPKIKLVVFGSLADDMKEEFDKYKENDNILYVGWKNQDEINNILLSGDLAIFPGTHSVLWENAVGCGLPCIFKKWDGINHVNVKDNCILLEEINQKILKDVILELFNDKEKYNFLLNNSEKYARVAFSYLEIAKRSIEY